MHDSGVARSEARADQAGEKNARTQSKRHGQREADSWFEVALHKKSTDDQKR